MTCAKRIASISLFPLVVWFASAHCAEFTTVPIVINILKNSGVTEAAAKKAVEQASEALKQANIKLTVVKTNVLAANDGDDGSGGGTAGDAVLTGAERAKVRETGGKEIETTENKKGLKITFAKTPQAESATNPGISVHRNPTVIVKELGNDAKNKQNIAHELAHALTLGPGHKIDATVTADGGGHAPDAAGKSGRENLMAPSDYNTGTHLTPDQIKTIADDRFLEKVGKTVKKELKNLGAKAEYQYGGITDSLNDQSASRPGFLDAFRAALSSERARTTIDTLLTLGGLFPDNALLKATYRLLVDTDANAGTGAVRNGFSGIEKEVVVQVERITFGGPLLISGQVTDTATSTSTPLPVAPKLLVGHELDNLAGASGVPVEHQFGFEIPKALLGLSADLVPIAFVTEDSSGSVPFTADSAAFLFDALRFARDGTLTALATEGFAGAPFPFRVTGLEPNSPFTLFLDEDAVFSGMLDALGQFEGSFIMPAVVPDEYFLTAQDATGEFAFNVISVPEPGTVALLVVALAFLLLRVLCRDRTHVLRPR